MYASSNRVFYVSWRTTGYFFTFGTCQCPRLVGVTGNDALTLKQEAFPTLDGHVLINIKLLFRKQSILRNHKRNRAWIWFAERKWVAPSSVFSAVCLRCPFKAVPSIAGIQHPGSGSGVFNFGFPVQKPKWRFTPVLFTPCYLSTPHSVLLTNTFLVPL